MKSTTNNKPSIITDEQQSNDIFKKAWVNVLANVITLLVLIYLAWQLSVWQLGVGAVLMAVGVVVSFAGLWLIKKDRLELGAWLILSVPLFLIFVLGLLIANLGVLLAIVVVIVTTVSAGQLMPGSKHINWAAITSFIVAFTVLSVDLFNLPYRFPASTELGIAALILTGIIVLGYGYFLWREYKNYSLRTKFIIIVLVAVLIPLTLLTVVNNYLTQVRLIDTANQSLLALASQTTNSLDTLIQSNVSAIDNEARLPLFGDFLVVDPPAQSNTQERLVLTNLARKAAPYILTYGLLDTDGINVVDSGSLNIGKDEADNDYFLVPMETGKSYVSPVLYDPESELWVIYFSAPVRNALGNKLGVLRAKYQAAFLQNFLQTTTENATEGAFTVLFDENQLHLAHSDPDIARETNYKLVDLPNDPAQITALQAEGRLPELPVEQLSTNLPGLEQSLSNLNPDAPFFEAVDTSPGGEQVVNQVAVAFLESQPWQLAYFQPQNILFEPVQVQTRNTVFLAVGISIVVAILAMVASRQLTRPIIRLTGVAQQVAQGDLSVKAPVESQDETGQLAQAFNSMTDQLRDLIGSLEDQVRERTAELAFSIEVGQRAVAIRELDTLLGTITEFIRERFNLYYVHVYFVDDLGKNLVIKSGTGTVGQTLMAGGHKLPIGSGSIVGQVAALGQPVVVSNTEDSTIHKPNPLLPDTRSEVAVPLVVENRVIGVLDMQSNQVDTFRQDNLTVFEAMATQLAISIDSAEQWELSQAAQQKSEETLKQLTQQQWAERLGARRKALGFAYDLSAISLLQPTDFDGGVSAPLIVQNQPIGQLAVSMPENRKLSADEQTLLNAVAQQLSQKAENLRLFEETQDQATREQLSRQIADKIRASRDIESALNTAAQELSQALGLTRTAIDLHIDSIDEAYEEVTASTAASVNNQTT